MIPATNALLTDLYQLNMMQAYLDHGETKTAVFELFVRRLPERRNFLMAAGLEPALHFLENLAFSREECDWIASTGRFKNNFLDYIAEFRFTGDVHAMPEGTIFFGNEPILRVTAPLPEAQLVETRLMNFLHFQSLVAAKAARMVLVAPGRRLVDFGLRRAHSSESGLYAARASYIAGFVATATVAAEPLFGIPIAGTMAHSFIQIHDDESVAFEHFARSRPASITLLIDTYDTIAGAHKVVALAPRLKADGITVRAVRLDSGDLTALSKEVRRILDDGGLTNVAIFASGGLDEDELAAIVGADAPIVGFGIGTSLATSSDVPALDCAYKIQEYAGKPRRKRSEGKATWPGRKQIWRQYGLDGRMAGDVVCLEDDVWSGEPLLRPVMRGGRRLDGLPTLEESRAHAARQLERLPDDLRDLKAAQPYRVQIADSLVRLADEVDRRIAHQERPPS